MTIQQILNSRRSLKHKMLNRQQVYGAWTSIGHPSITEILARSGVDFVGIDIEHSTIDQTQCQRIIACCHAAGVLCLPRIASHDSQMSRRLLDSGADGLIVPMVENAEQARQMVMWAKYPPVGKRGYGVGRAQGYGMDFDAYASTWNDSSILMAQIESVSAVSHIDQILAVEGLDAVMVGPYDISGSLNVPGQLSHPKVKEAAQTIIEASRRANKGCATQIVDPHAALMQQAQQEGYTITVLASDVFILWKWAERIANEIKSV